MYRVRAIDVNTAKFQTEKLHRSGPEVGSDDQNLIVRPDPKSSINRLFVIPVKTEIQVRFLLPAEILLRNAGRQKVVELGQLAEYFGFPPVNVSRPLQQVHKITQL